MTTPCKKVLHALYVHSTKYIHTDSVYLLTLDRPRKRHYVNNTKQPLVVNLVSVLIFIQIYFQ